MNAFLCIMDGNSPEGQALLKQYQEAIKETEVALKEEVKDALDNAEKKANKKTQHLESLVRMLFLQKSERFCITDEEMIVLNLYLDFVNLIKVLHLIVKQLIFPPLICLQFMAT